MKKVIFIAVLAALTTLSACSHKTLTPDTHYAVDSVKWERLYYAGEIDGGNLKSLHQGHRELLQMDSLSAGYDISRFKIDTLTSTSIASGVSSGLHNLKWDDTIWLGTTNTFDCDNTILTVSRASGEINTMLRVSQPDSTGLITVKFSRKKVTWLNDSTFTIQTKPLNILNK